MIKLTFALVRRADFTRERFQAYWFEQHGPLVRGLAEALGIVEYVQLHSLDEPAEGKASDRLRWSPSYDGLAQIWYANRRDFEVRMAMPVGREAAAMLRNDELRFIDRKNSPRWWGLERRIL